MQVPHRFKDYYRRVTEDLRAEAKAEGLVEGKAEGEAAGEARGLAAALIIALEARFGTLAPALAARVSAMPNDRLLRGIAQTVKNANLEAILDD